MKRNVLTIIFVFAALRMIGQINSDSIFNSAILNAKQGNYEKALEEASSLVEALPNRYDIRVFLANVYGWKGDFISAKDQIDKAYTINNRNNELYDAWLNILLWSDDYKKLIETADLARQNGYDNEYNLVLKKAIAYKELNRYSEGLHLINGEKQFLDSLQVNRLYNEMLMLDRSRAITLYYSPTFFDYDSKKPQHLAYIDYSFKVNRNIFIPRVNYAHRYNNDDFLIESDYYHLFKNGQYLYANFGVGLLNELFPDYRGGIEFFSPIAKSMEASIGGRYLYAGGNNVFILTGHLSKYVKNLWFSLRPYYAIHDTDAIKNTISIVANSRYFGANSINYWGLELLYGTSPDERSMILSPSMDPNLLSSYRIKLERNVAIFKTNELKLTSAYTYEEYQKSTYGNRFTFELFFKHKF